MHKVKIEIADTPSKQAQGLMFRKSMEDDAGMLFSFKTPQRLKFWGLNTYMHLDIAFISSDKKIEKICHISPLSEKVVASDKDCNYALEVNAGYFAKNNIRTGDSIELGDDCVIFEKNKGN